MTSLNNDLLKYSFEYDVFQIEAFNNINNGNNVLVSCPTSSGKTLVAKYAILYNYYKHPEYKIFYTSPVKALSNQIYSELSKEFQAKYNITVGLMTGDNQINKEATLIIITTEILRNMLFVQSEYIKNTSCVILDEIHYINEKNRGKIWEETIILMNNETQLIGLSATINNPYEFGNWIEKCKQKPLSVVVSNKRIVPLQYYFYIDSHAESQIMKKKKNFIFPFESNLVQISNSNKEYQPNVFFKTGDIYELYKNTKYTINDFIKFMISDDIHKNKFCNENDGLMPTIIFVFSKKQCQEYSDMITESVISVQQGIENENVFDNYLRQYKHILEPCNSYHHLKKLIIKGVAYHHSGMHVLLKEVVEKMYGKYIKLIIATETLSVGLNLPTRTCVLANYKKNCHGTYKYIDPSDFGQMAGRAGRRGLDTFGNVVLLSLDDFPTEGDFKNILHGNVKTLTSNMCLDGHSYLKSLVNKLDNDTFYDNSFLKLKNIDEISEYNKLLDKINNEYIEIKEKYDNMDKDVKKILEELENITNKQDDFGDMKIKLSKKQLQEQKDLNNKLKKYSNELNIYRKYKQINEEYELINDKLYYSINYKDTTFNKIKNFLQHFKYIDDNNNITTKGIIASYINECNPFILTEIITNGMLKILNIYEIVALLSIFVETHGNEYNGRKDDNILFIDKKIKEYTDYFANDINISSNENWEIYTDYMDIAYNWAIQCDSKEILKKLNDVGEFEGNFVKMILKINNIVTNIINILKLINILDDVPKLEQISSKILRDFVTTASIYLSA